MIFFVRKLAFILVVSCSCAATIAYAETLEKYISGLHQAEPEFSEYPVTVGKLKEAKSPDLFSNKLGRKYRSVITEGFKAPANLAGKYVTFDNGCGSGCKMNWIVSKETGKIISDPIVTSSGIEFKPDSELVIVDPYAGFKDADMNELPGFWSKTSFYKIENDHLRLIKEIGLPVERK